MIYPDMIVSLTRGEWAHAMFETARAAEAITFEGRTGHDRGGVGVDPDDPHANGKLDLGKLGNDGELAFAKWSGRYWSGMDRARGDVADYFEIRTRRGDPRQEAPPLLIQKYDEDRNLDKPFILVVGGIRYGLEYRIVGYITPREARRLVEAGELKIADPGKRNRPAIVVPEAATLPCDAFKVGMGATAWA